MQSVEGGRVFSWQIACTFDKLIYYFMSTFLQRKYTCHRAKLFETSVCIVFNY